MDTAFKARWMMMFGAVFFVLGLSGRVIVTPGSTVYDVCGIGIAVGIVLFIQGMIKMRAALREMDEPENPDPPET